MRLSNTAEYAFSATETLLFWAAWRAGGRWWIGSPSNPWAGVPSASATRTLPYSDYLGDAVVADNMYLSLLVETRELPVWPPWCGCECCDFCALPRELPRALDPRTSLLTGPGCSASGARRR